MKKLLLAITVVFAFSVLMTGMALAENHTNTTNNETVDMNVTIDTNSTVDMNQTNSTNSTVDMNDTVDTNTTVDINDTIDMNETDMDDNETLEEDLNETLVMRSVPGAQVRLFQLEKSIEKNILTGQEIIDRLNDTNTSELETILDQLEDLQDRVANYEIPEEYSSQVALDYVALKAEARDLSKDFRELLRNTASAEELADLREAAKNREQEVRNTQREELQNEIRKYNAMQFEKLQERLQLNLTELKERFEEGQVDIKEAKQEVKEQLKAFGQEKRQDALERLQEDNVRGKIAKEDVRNNLPPQAKGNGRGR